MLGLALEGGGTMGAAHVGVLRALLEEGVKIDCIGGTSAGSWISAAYAWQGRMQDVDALYQTVLRLGSHILDFNFRGLIKGVSSIWTSGNFSYDGVFRGDRLERVVRKATGGATLAQTRLPVVITAVDAVTGKVLLYTSKWMRSSRDCIIETQADLCRAVRASSAIPVAFCPVSQGHMVLVDGGVLLNMPAQALFQMGCTQVLGVVLDAEPKPGSPPDDIIAIGFASIDAMQKKLEKLESCQATQLIRVTLPPGSGAFSFDQMEVFERLGYQAAKEQLPDILPKLRSGQRMQCSL